MPKQHGQIRCSKVLLTHPVRKTWILSLLLVQIRAKIQIESELSLLVKHDGITPQVVFPPSLSGFLKRISKDKKKGPDPNLSCEFKDEDEPNSICSVAAPVNSTEHYLRRSSLPEHSNSSDSDSGNEELDKKMNIQIKPVMCDSVSGSASVDELREAIGSMTFTPVSAQGNIFSKNIWNTDASTVSKVHRLKPGMVLRPAKTGDDKWNNLVLAEVLFYAVIGKGFQLKSEPRVLRLFLARAESATIYLLLRLSE
ncbi:hypothetical protein TTRE_0000922301 [Trichuris trichiura]|uniref:Uncharacterized protein n=1 Tax=Trichuris trichiura TaxID=36087 RepID=A0A077ZM61_TRITR|nr:hypothetical protein TTRE_0000922301 [Trichuris trichiura]